MKSGGISNVVLVTIHTALATYSGARLIGPALVFA
jgi:hypothetical protein